MQRKNVTVSLFNFPPLLPAAHLRGAGVDCGLISLALCSLSPPPVENKSHVLVNVAFQTVPSFAVSKRGRARAHVFAFASEARGRRVRHGVVADEGQTNLPDEVWKKGCFKEAPVFSAARWGGLRCDVERQWCLCHNSCVSIAVFHKMKQYFFTF